VLTVSVVLGVAPLGLVDEETLSSDSLVDVAEALGRAEESARRRDEAEVLYPSSL
jgi:hypothetical protein